MCGIVGVIPGLRSPRDPRIIRNHFETLLRASESRGKEASGVVWVTPDLILAFKSPEPVSAMLRREEYQCQWREAQRSPGGITVMLGHSRLATHGSESDNAHNQPVLDLGFALIHNGIITNCSALWSDLGRTPPSELDSAILPHLLVAPDRGLPDIENSLTNLKQQIEGTVSIAFAHAELDDVWLYTNHGSLFLARFSTCGTVAFASEWRFFRPLGIPLNQIEQLPAGASTRLPLRQGRTDPKRARKIILAQAQPAATSRVPPAPEVFSPRHWDRFEPDYEAIARLRRCSRGILPHTMPFINFDAEGVSNYAREHRKYCPVGEAVLHERIRHSLHQGKRKWLVAFSGGRDSSYALLRLKQMGIEPVAYTYDWGMVTDLARRNQARICGRLGIEHILVSADIRRKRDYIRRNVLAWLKRPHLGSIPLFMAGDKQYFYHANQLRKIYQFPEVVLASNPYERTNFKTGFAGIPPRAGTRPGLISQISLLAFYAGEFFRNPAYLNRSLLDTASAFLSYYSLPHDYLRIFEMIRWEETAIENELATEFGWEKASDTTTTWRIGDGTAAFYNYIFLHVAGFTENDTFRNSQVLDGALSRDEALQRVTRENAPRFESIEWYCRTVGLDPIEVLSRIRSLPTLYGT